MEWGDETVYAVLGGVVASVLTWLARGFQVKKPLNARIEKLEARLNEERIEAREERVRAREETAALREQIATASKADAMLTAVRAFKEREEALEMQRKRQRRQRLQDAADMMGIPYRGDDE